MNKLPPVRGPRTRRIVMITPSDSSLTADEEVFARKHWEQFDTEKTERLDMAELPSLLRHMGIFMDSKRLDRYYRLFFGQTYDTMEDDIEYDRFLILLSMILRNQLPIYRHMLLDIPEKPDFIQFAFRGIQDARNLFLEFDKDERNGLSRDELREMFNSFAIEDKYEDDFDTYVTKLLKVVDKDQSGEVTFDEFVECYNSLLDIIN